MSKPTKHVILIGHYSFFYLSLISFLQVAKFPFEEVAVNKQGAKQEPCPPSSVQTSATATGSAAVLETEVKTGEKDFS